MGLIRLLLAISVLCEHTRFDEAFGFTAIVGGPLAVQAFFMVSGFYIGLVLDTRYNKNWLFWSNRALRIYPVYWLIALLTFVYAFLFDRDSLAGWPVLGWGIGAVMVISLLVIFGQDLWLFSGVKNHSLFLTSHFQTTNPPLYTFLLIPQAWSLALELYFYLLAPFLARLRTSNLLGLVVSLFFLRFIFYAKSGLSGDPWSYRFFPFELGLFLLGVVAYRVYRKMQLPTPFCKVQYSVSICAIILYPLWQGYLTELHLAGWSVLIIVFAVLPAAFQLSGHNKLDRMIGDLSYPLYVSHILCARLVARTGLFNTAFSTTVAVLLVSLLLSAWILKFVDSPLMRIRERRVIG